MRNRFLIVAAILAVPGGARASTLFDELGARSGVERLVSVATEIFTTDPRISDTFADTNLDRFREKLAEQLCQVSDGGCAYTGQSMAAAHKGLHIGTKQFNALVEDLEGAMDRMSIPVSVQNRLIARLAPMYRDVVTR